MISNPFRDKPANTRLEGRNNLTWSKFGHEIQSVVNLFVNKGIRLLLIGICLSFMVNAQVSKSVIATPGGLSAALTTDELQTVTNLTLTGTIDARDFKTMRDEMPLLAVLDIRQVNIAAYNGGDGPDIWWFTDYSANKIPVSSFVDGYLTGKTSLTSILLPSSLTAIGAYAFYNCSGLTSIVIPPLVTQIDGNAFNNCTGLKTVDIPSLVTNLGYCVFQGCSSLTSVSIPSSVTSIGESCFSYCNNLESVLIPSTVKCIGTMAFMGCKSLTLINLPSSIDSIGQGSFNNCTGLKSVNIPSSITTIGDWFTNCTSLGSITIPSTVKTIGSGAFVGCSNLTSISIPSSVVSIGENAFENCTGLTSVTIGSSVTNIGDYAFKDCSKLISLTVEAYVPPVISLSAQYVFNNVDRSSCLLNVPYGTTTLYATAYQWKDFSHIVVPVYDLYISSDRATIASQSGSIATIEITTNDAWTLSSDQNWLVVSPASGTGNKTLTFTAEANYSLGDRKATVTVFSLGLEPKTITLTQNGTNAILNISPGSLASVLTPDEMKIVTTLTLTGNIDARDFKTIRDNMPKLSVLDLEDANIDAYTGVEGTTIYGNNNYTANTIPEFAFYNGVTGKTSLVSVVFPMTVTAIGQRALSFCSGLKSIKVDWPIPIDLTYTENVFNGWDKNACTLYVPYGRASRYSVANQWKDFTHLTEAIHGFNLSSYSDTIAFEGGTTSTVNLYANVDWIASSDQPWLAVTPSSDNKTQILNFTAKENTLLTNRTAIVTVSASGVPSQTFTITQNIQPQPIITLALTAGELSTLLTPEVLNTISVLTLTGTIDARDFKTMRDKMPVLSELDLSGVNIIAYNGSEGTSYRGNIDYPANAIPEMAFLRVKYQYDGTYIYTSNTPLVSVVLPSSLWSIESTAFMYCINLSNIVIPSTVTTIKSEAFSFCESLTTVTIPSLVKVIGSNAFASCYSLFSLIIPSSVTSIGNGAFYDCRALTSLKIPLSVISIAGGAFENCILLNAITVIWANPINLSSSYNVFYEVDKNICTLYVPYGTFSRYKSADQWKDFTHIVEMPGFFLQLTTTTIESQEGSKSSVDINSDIIWTASSDQDWLSVNTASGIGTGQKLIFTAEANPKVTTRSAKITVSAPAVESQTVLVVQEASILNITAGGLATSLTADEFKSLTKLTLSGTIDARDFKTMRDSMPSLAEVDLSRTTIVEYKGFLGTSILFHNNYAANTIPENAFMNNSYSGKTSLTSIVLPTSITSIGQYAFGFCTGLTNMVIPPLVTSIGNSAFYYCRGLTTAFIPSTVLFIGDSAFGSCSELASLTVSCSVPPDLRFVFYVFSNVNQYNCKLYVPYGSSQLYSTSEEWRYFMNIIELSPDLVADAGPEQVINEGTQVTLDGSASKNAENSAMIYQWTAPEGIILSSETAVYPTFIAPEVTEDTVYTFELTVSVGSLISTIDRVRITVKQVNKAPIASAGIDQFVNENSMVTLDGSASNDPDNDQLSYLWTSPEGIILSSATAVNPTFTAPEVTSDTSYTFSLTVSDGSLNSIADQVVITVKQVNKAPLANAGTDQSVKENSMVTLDGSASNDPDNDQLSYLWTAPAGITLSSATTVNPTFTAPEVTSDTNYTFSLTVSDCSLYSISDQVVITVKQVNKAPIANAGTDQSVNENSLITLNGSASADPDNDQLSYLWTAPAGITLSSATTVNPTFTAPEVTSDTNYTFSLTVSDGSLYSISDQVVITVKQVNKAPIANAGTDQSVNENSLVTLDGSASTDPDNDQLSYLWIAPAGITLSKETAWNTTFTAPNVNQDTVFTFKLVVNDGIINSDTSKIQITVKQVLPVLKLITKTNDSVLPANEVSYQLFLKQGETYIVQNVPFQLNGDTTQFTIHAGEWIVLASPAQNSSLFIPTYLGNALDWIDAEHVIIQDNENLFKEITCVAPEITNSGTGQISGVVYESSYTGTKSVSIINTPELSDNPISEVLVRLFKRDSTVPILSVFTDSLGCYKFDRLEIAEYDLVVELPGYTKSGKFGISLSAEGPVATAYFAVNTTTQVITDNNLLLFSMVTIYPNPVLSDVTVDVGRTINGPYSISVYNVQGKLLIHREVTAVKNTLDFSALLSGTYLIQVCIGTEKLSSVIIKR